MSDATEPVDVPPGADGESGLSAGYTRALRYVLTGEHEIHTVAGVVLRFFLADGGRNGLEDGWRAVTDREFQFAYENSLFDMEAAKRKEIRPNTRYVQLTLDALAGAGAYFWSDGYGAAGVMTANGKTPEECGFRVPEARGRSGRGGGA
ncbi:hypothetical protein OYE22_11865 [Streptomyces sp. 71268]|uniref:hypothetical protein n=1 Tax=Streptomyces sp. 71268 TaxID=3002640 RepID=UPI0023F9E970|nr:hypothetical protein [Streptomyces sp. 71268]WEV25815.1 hypothetical protein OYE22_11865 [Streptomyces sp. 71268]